MKRLLGLLIIFLLISQTLMVGLGVEAQVGLDGTHDSVFTDISIEQEAEDSNHAHINISWSVKDITTESMVVHTVTIPEEVARIETQQNGGLVSNDIDIGTYTVYTYGLVEITFNNEIENHPDTEGIFSIDAVVDTQKETVENPVESALDNEHSASVNEGEESQDTVESNGTTEKNKVENKQTKDSQELKTESNERRIEETVERLIENQSLLAINESSVIEENIIKVVQLSVLDENGQYTILNPETEIIVDNPYSAFKVKLDYGFALPNGHDYTEGSTFTISIPEVFHVLANPEPIPLLSENGIQFGEFIVTSDNKIVITFNEIIEENSNISGYINLESEFAEHYNGKAETEITFPIEGEGTVTYPIRFIPTGSSIDKIGVPNRAYNTETITWTVDFNKNLQEITEASLRDVMEGDQSFVEGSLEVYQLHMNADGSFIVGDKLETHSFGEEFPLNLGTIDSAYRIVYDTTINDNTGERYKNTAILEGKEAKPVQASATVGVKRGNPLSKQTTGYDNVSQTITWEVKYNYDEKKIPQNLAKLTDVLGVNQQFDENFGFEVYEVVINPNTGEEDSTTFITPEEYYVSHNENGFVFEFKQNIDKAYKIVYQTMAVNRIDENAYIENTIRDEFENEISSGRTIQQGIFIKSHVGNTNYENKTTDWKILINRDEHVMKDVVLNDTLPEGLTPKNVQIRHDGQMLTQGEDYTYTFNEDTRKIEIQFINNITKKLEITYTTVINFDEVNPNNVTFTNRALVEWVPENSSERISKEGTATFNPDNYTKNNGFKGATYNPVTKEITWTIGVNYNKITIPDMVVEDYILGDQNFDINNVKVYSMTLTGNDDGYEKGEEIGDLPIREVTNGNGEPGFIVELGTINTPYVIEYTTDLNGLLVHKKYDNKAIIKSNNELVNELVASVQPVHGGEYTKKYAEQSHQNPRIVNWKVNINFTQSTVNNLKIEDTPSINQALLKDTIKLYGTIVTENGITKDPNNLLEENIDYTVEVNENENGQEMFLIEFIDMTIDHAYVLEYDTYILYKGDGNISNDAQFFANETTEVETDDSYTRQINLSNIGGGIDGEVGSLQITKVDHTDNTKSLEGAAFELYDATGQTLLKTGTTDRNGLVTFKNLLHADYILKEVTAPDGYVVGIAGEQMITVDAEVTELEVKNKKIVHDVKLIKVDDTNNNPLEGAVFELFKEGETTPLSEHITNHEGIISVTNLETGNYQFKEKQAPEGYLLNQNPSSFTIKDKATEVVTLTVTNKAIETMPLQGEKIWKDGNSPDRPDTITVNLLQNSKIFKTTEVTAQTNWSYSFVDVPRTDALGNPFEYTIEEQPVEGYETTIDGNNITNLRVGKTVVSGIKIWKDDNSPERPESITVNLLQNGEKVASQDVTAESDWTYSFTNLEKYDENGVAYAYTVEEEAVEGYETTIDGNNITNLRVGKTVVSGMKTWKDDNSPERPESITVNLLQNGEEMASQDVTAESDWTYSFTNLEKYDENGVAYAYTVEEEAVEGYEKIINGYDITNIRVGKTEVSGTKIWKDNTDVDRPDSIKVNLLQNGIVIDTIEVTADDNWTYSFTELDKYDEEGVAYDYTINEHNVLGYQSEVVGYDIINTRSEKKSIIITKNWLDDNSKNRPESITVTLLQNGVEYDSVTITKSENWSYEFKGLEAFDENGIPYEYSIKEQSVDNYQTTINDYIITNLRVGKTEVSGMKTWKDDNSPERPESITVNLLQNGKEIASQEVTAETNWTYSFIDLEKYDENGVAYAYTLEEEAVEGYEAIINGFDITNLRIGKTTLELKKVWKNDNMTDRPEVITVNLLQNGKIIESVDISAKSDWKYIFIDLPKYNQEGKVYTYTIEEDPVKGYETTVVETATGFEITNTKIMEPEISNKEKLPKTGDRVNYLLTASGTLFILLAGVIVYFSRRSRSHSDN